MGNVIPGGSVRNGEGNAGSVGAVGLDTHQDHFCVFWRADLSGKDDPSLFRQAVRLRQPQKQPSLLTINRLTERARLFLVGGERIPVKQNKG